VGAEPRALHLARVKLGLMRLRLDPWPHAGPVMVREASDELEQLHLIDGWQHLATVEAGECDLPLDELARTARARTRAFEIDEYRILTRMLRDAPLRPVPI
jgi:DNA polymerase-3 subunit epsilon